MEFGQIGLPTESAPLPVGLESRIRPDRAQILHHNTEGNFAKETTYTQSFVNFRNVQVGDYTLLPWFNGTESVIY